MYLYCLIHPDTKREHYVGTCTRPKERKREHLAARAKCAVSEWVRELKAQGKEPIFKVLAKIVVFNGDMIDCRGFAKAAERKAIISLANRWHGHQHQLLNIKHNPRSARNARRKKPAAR